jgi:hypothetical protein
VRSRMWRDLRRSAAAGVQRVSQGTASSAGPPPNGSLRLSCCRNRMTSWYSRGSLVSRWQTGSEPGTVVSLQRAVGRSNSRVFKGGLDLPRMNVAPGQSRLRGCMAAPSTRFHALGQMAVSRLKMMYFSLRKIALGEPSRGRAGTWQRQVQLQAAPRCRQVRVQHEATWLPTGSAGQEERAGLALLDGLMDQFHKRGTKSVQRALRSKSGTARSLERH